jgi:hypothetical protein
MSKQLYEPILDNGIRNVHFFNGRLLTADDLKDEQVAARRQHTQLGRAAGEGVVEGLEVLLMSEGSATASPVVLVTKGLALNRSGYALSLPGNEEVALVRRLEAAPPEAGLFSNCDAPRHSFGSLENGFYVLAIAPASGFNEHAPARGHRPGGGVTGCGSRYAVEGVQFRFPKVDLTRLSGPAPDTPPFDPAVLAEVETLLALNDDLSRSKLRNLLAHLCFGTTQLSGGARDPFKKVTEPSRRERSFYSSYGVSDAMRASGALTDCDVPLALIYWTGGLVRFVDMWPVRRRVHARPDAKLSHLLTPRRLAEAEASFFQLQEHLQWLLNRLPNPHLLNAADAFRWLPAAGLVPQRSSAHPTGFANHRFFANKMIGSLSPLRGAKLRTLLAESLHYSPVDLTRRELVQTYTVEENSQALNDPNPPQPYVVFAHQEMPYYSYRPRFFNLCQTLRETREAYRDLVQRNVLLGDVTRPEGLTPRLLVSSALQAVASAAGAHYASCGSLVTQEKGVELLGDLYELQKVLTAVMSRDWGSVPVGRMREYAAILDSHLDTATPGDPTNKPSLGAAVAARDLRAATDAQDAIIRLVRSWTAGPGGPGGGSVEVIGNLEVSSRSGRTGTLVRAATSPFVATFRVTNRSNIRLNARLSAAFEGAPSEDWNRGVHLVTPPEASGGALPLAIDEFRDIDVEVTTPPGATDGQSATLRFTAQDPVQPGIIHRDAIVLTVGPASAPPSPAVEFDPGAPLSIRGGDPSAAPLNTRITYALAYRYHVPPELIPAGRQPPPQRFRCFVRFEGASGADARNLSVNFAGPVSSPKRVETDPSIVSDTVRATQPFELTNDVDDSVDVVVRALAPLSLDFRISIEAVDDSAIRTASTDLLSITAR